MDPATLYIAAMGAQALGSLMGAQGAMEEAAASKGQLRTQAVIDDLNAGYVLQDAQAAQQRLLLRASQMKGRQKSAFAANGVDVTSDVALKIFDDTDYMAQQDAATVNQNARREAYGYKVDAAQKRAAAKAISVGGAGLTSLLGGAAQFGSAFASGKQSGII